MYPTRARAVEQVRSRRPASRGAGLTAALTAACLLMACATGSSSARMISRQATPHRAEPMSMGSVVTASDFARLNSQQSLLDALTALRPNWLRFRGVSPTVALDGVLLGPPGNLRDIPLSWVERVEILHGPEATFRYGSRHTGAVIEVSTRRGAGLGERPPRYARAML